MDASKEHKPTILESNSQEAARSFCDSSILSGIIDALNDDELIDSTHIDVIVHDGEVRLLGEVDNFKSKQAAESYAINRPGVKTVSNELLVKLFL